MGVTEEKHKAPKVIKDLIERYKRNQDEYKGKGYNEFQLRNEFITPFFEALGWDVYNKSGAAPAYRDVILEDSIKIGSRTKAPDYCFTLSGRRMFFVETKKPSVTVKKDAKSAFQLRRYAWSSKLPLSILTNFEEFIVYECRQRPHVSDKPEVERIFSIPFTKYIEKWDEIYNIFSFEAVKQGSFDRYAKEVKKKRGTQEVDDEFLKEMEEWREKLAKNIAVRNPDLSVRELNYSIQRTIDRIIFLRMCEDKGIEKFDQLRSIAGKDNIYSNLCEIFKKADEKYNSGLFHFKKERDRITLHDELTLKLNIDDNILRNIFRHLYYPNSPYEFSVISPEILGNVYEQFLGKIIRLTEGHRAKIEEKPEVRKAGGVYYTPQYIVDYIVENTVGKMIEGKTPGQISKLKILDPACGSGSFLIGTYSKLLQYHLGYYSTRKNPKKYKDQIFLGKDREWSLTIKEKKRILLNNIFGVDIDSQAVEVTKLSLLLKVLEGESKDIFEKQQKLWKERALPDLGNNIKCGNSLIGPNYLQQTALFNETELERINIFDWHREFTTIMEKGGFDAVIGNPPYVRQETIGNLKSYFSKHFDAYHGTADLYVYFIERALSLLQKNGMFGFIISNKWMLASYGRPLRKWIKHQGIQEIIDFGDLPVFKKATTYPSIILINKSKVSNSFKVIKVNTLQFSDLAEYVSKNKFSVKIKNLDDEGWFLADTITQRLLTRLKEHGRVLGEYINGEIYRGILTGLDKAFVIDEKTRQDIINKDPKSSELIKPYLIGREIKRYHLQKLHRYLILIPSGWTRVNKNGATDAWDWFSSNYSGIASHLEKFKKDAEKRYDKGEYWWELRSCDYYDIFEKPKIMYLKFQVNPAFILDKSGHYSNSAIFSILKDDLFLLGLLNSKLGWFLISNYCTKIQNGYQLIYNYLKKIPIPFIDLSNPDVKSKCSKIVNLVERNINLHKELSKSKITSKKEMIIRNINANDQIIDNTIFELYDLNEGEKKIVRDF